MLVEKHKPEGLSEVVGQKLIIQKIFDYLDKWKSGKALLLYGPTGTGKTMMVELVAKEKNFNLVEINPSEDNIVSYIRETLLPASKEGSLFSKRLILIDEIDSFSDRGAIAEIIKIVRESASPIVMTANDAYNNKLKALRSYCILVRVNRVPINLIENELKKIASREEMKISDDVIRRIASCSDGDLRAAINDLETFTEMEFGIRDREVDIFKVLKVIFQSNDIDSSRKAIDESDKDVEDIMWWIEQNIPNELENRKDIAEAFDLLSKADLFRSKIVASQNYRFKKYMKDMIAGITLIGKNRKFVMYKPPDRLIFLGRTKAMRSESEEMYQYLGNVLHCSKRKVREQMPYLNVIMNKV